MHAGELLFSSLAPLGAVPPFRLPAAAEPVLRALDGDQSAAQVIDQFQDEFGREALIGVLRTLTPWDLGAIAPLW